MAAKNAAAPSSASSPPNAVVVARNSADPIDSLARLFTPFDAHVARHSAFTLLHRSSPLAGSSHAAHSRAAKTNGTCASSAFCPTSSTNAPTVRTSPSSASAPLSNVGSRPSECANPPVGRSGSMSKNASQTADAMPGDDASSRVVASRGLSASPDANWRAGTARTRRWRLRRPGRGTRVTSQT